MLLLRREPGLSVREAAAWLRVMPNTVSTLVGQLAQAGLVRREHDPQDRRVVRLELTEGAQRRLLAWRDERADVLRGALERLAPDDRRALEQALGSLSRLAALLDRGSVGD